MTDTAPGYLEAARNGLLPITWFPTGQRLHNFLELYRKEVSAVTGELPRPLGAGNGVLRIAYVAPTEDEARLVTEAMVTNYFHRISEYRGPTTMLDEGEDPADPKFQKMTPWDILMERDQIFIGTPDSVTERILRFGKEHGIERLLLQFGYGGVSNEQAESAVELFAKEVMPALASVDTALAGVPVLESSI